MTSQETINDLSRRAKNLRSAKKDSPIKAADGLLQELQHSQQVLKEVCAYISRWNPNDLRVSIIERQLAANSLAIANAKEKARRGLEHF